MDSYEPGSRRRVVFEYNGFVFVSYHYGIDYRDAEQLLKVEMKRKFGIEVSIVH